MKIITLTAKQTSAFLDFCRKSRDSVDDSFLYEENLALFVPGTENPTLLAIENGQIIAAASLMTEGVFSRSRSSRFRIFHADVEDYSLYEALHYKITKNLTNFNSIYLFINTLHQGVCRIFSRLGYEIEGYSFLLIRQNSSPPLFSLPQKYKITLFRRGQDEENWCHVRNAAFSLLRGSTTPLTPADLISRLKRSEGKDGELFLLFHEDRPVGVVQCEADEWEGKPAMNIGPLAVIPEFQGRGLGRHLLRYAINFSCERGYEYQVLCVNAENSMAKKLYEEEGFVQVESVGKYIFTFDK